MEQKTRIIILNYNGAELLPQCLPSIVEAARNSPYPTAVTVLDNQSPEASGLDYVKRAYPQVSIVLAPENRVLCSYNDYLKTISEPVVILLNNDIRVHPDFVGPLAAPFFEDPSCFLVAPRCMSWKGESFVAGKSKWGVKWGMFWCSNQYPGYEKDADKPGDTAAAGFGAFSREKFLELGGYDDRFLPGIMEDADLCYRAAQKGYHLRYEPKSVVHHLGQATFKKKFGQKGIQVLAWRNNFLFMWKNLRGWKFYLSHSLFTPLRILISLCRGNTAILEGFSQAIKKERNDADKR